MRSGYTSSMSHDVYQQILTSKAIYNKVIKAYHKSGSTKGKTSCQFRICRTTTTTIRMKTTNLLYILDRMMLSGSSANLNVGTGMKTVERSEREVWCLECLLYNTASEGMVNTNKHIQDVENKTPYFQLRVTTVMLINVANLNKEQDI